MSLQFLRFTQTFGWWDCAKIAINPAWLAFYWGNMENWLANWLAHVLKTWWGLYTSFGIWLFWNVDFARLLVRLPLWDFLPEFVFAMCMATCGSSFAVPDQPETAEHSLVQVFSSTELLTTVSKHTLIRIERAPALDELITQAGLAEIRAPPEFVRSVGPGTLDTCTAASLQEVHAHFRALES
jgi:hypothetical protein